MSMKRRSVVLAALLAGLLSSTAVVSAQAMTLEEALALTYETNPGLLAERAQLRAVDENVSQARAAWRPQVSSSLSAGVADVETEISGVTTTDATKFPRTGNLNVVRLCTPAARSGRRSPAPRPMCSRNGPACSTPSRKPSSRRSWPM